MDVWSTSINELLQIFLDSLYSLIPSIKKAHIFYSDINSYDDWDNIVEVLFNSIIINSILNSGINGLKIFPKYGVQNNNFRGKSVIALKRSINTKYLEIFINFCHLDNEIPCILIGKIDKITQNVYEYSEIVFKEVEFVILRNTENDDQMIENLEVTL